MDEAAIIMTRQNLIWKEKILNLFGWEENKF